MRYRLIPTRRGDSWYEEGAEVAENAAHRHWHETGIPVLICEAPKGGLVRTAQIVGQVPAKVRRA